MAFVKKIRVDAVLQARKPLPYGFILLFLLLDGSSPVFLDESGWVKKVLNFCLMSALPK